MKNVAKVILEECRDSQSAIRLFGVKVVLYESESLCVSMRLGDSNTNVKNSANIIVELELRGEYNDLLIADTTMAYRTNFVANVDVVTTQDALYNCYLILNKIRTTVNDLKRYLYLNKGVLTTIGQKLLANIDDEDENLQIVLTNSNKC